MNCVGEIMSHKIPSNATIAGLMGVRIEFNDIDEARVQHTKTDKSGQCPHNTHTRRLAQQPTVNTFYEKDAAQSTQICNACGVRVCVRESWRSSIFPSSTRTVVAIYIIIIIIVKCSFSILRQFPVFLFFLKIVYQFFFQALKLPQQSISSQHVSDTICFPVTTCAQDTLHLSSCLTTFFFLFFSSNTFQNFQCTPSVFVLVSI